MYPHASSLLAPVTALACVLLAHPSTAPAQTWTETVDAGELIASAQVTVGDGPLWYIQGLLPVGTDVDMFCIRIVDAESFAAVTPCGNAQANDLWLFDSTGFGVVHDDGCTDNLVRLTGAFVPAAGTYYLTISGNNSEARSGVYPIWDPVSSNGERAPDGLGSFAALNQWGGSNRTASSPYEIHLTGCEPCEKSVQTLGTTWGRMRAIYR